MLFAPFGKRCALESACKTCYNIFGDFYTKVYYIKGFDKYEKIA